VYCRQTTIKEIATLAKQSLDAAAEQVGPEAYKIYVFFQSYEQQAGGGHLHYGLHCDRSYGGTKKAEQAVRKALPNDLFCIADEPGECEEQNVHERFEEALADL
jgi:hypothetical protein